jgi:hypothetical protein
MLKTEIEKILHTDLPSEIYGHPFHWIQGLRIASPSCISVASSLIFKSCLFFFRTLPHFHEKVLESLVCLGSLSPWFDRVDAL